MKSNSRFLNLALCITLISSSSLRWQFGAVDMLHLKQRMAYLGDAAGQGLVEYAMILLLVAIAVVATVAAFGQALNGYYMDAIRRLPFPW